MFTLVKDAVASARNRPAKVCAMSVIVRETVIIICAGTTTVRVANLTRVSKDYN